MAPAAHEDRSSVVEERAFEAGNRAPEACLRTPVRSFMKRRTPPVGRFARCRRLGVERARDEMDPPFAVA
jgi:hypothetical protein